jgi:HAD superfamily hydrolase (TIGR01549 family)
MQTQSRPRHIAAVGFDFDHTLGIDNKLERVAFLRLLDEGCSRGGRCIDTLAGEIERIDALLERQRAGEFTIEHAVETFVSARGMPHAARWIERYKTMCLEMVRELVIPQPDARSTLASLRERNIPCAILTNGWSPLQQQKAQCVGFDGPVLVSADLGVQKPEPAAFEALARVMDVAVAELAYVGDTPASDVAGSLRCGLIGIWFDAEGVSYQTDLPRPSAVIHSLAELLALV